MKSPSKAPKTRFPYSVRAQVFAWRNDRKAYARIVELVREHWPDTQKGFTVDDAIACFNEATAARQTALKESHGGRGFGDNLGRLQ